MKKLAYSISLREKGFDANEIRTKMKEHGFEESEIDYYLKRSDEIFLNRLHRNNKAAKPKGKLGKGIKTIVMMLSLLLLLSAFLGYARIGLIGLFVIWSLVGISAAR